VLGRGAPDGSGHLRDGAATYTSPAGWFAQQNFHPVHVFS
jgi:hypothetical protein